MTNPASSPGGRLDALPSNGPTPPSSNPTDGPVVLLIEMRPALRWVEFTTRFLAGEDPIALLEEFADEVVLPPS